jgi:hypothetical protein
MAKASEQMEKALKVSECVPEIGTGGMSDSESTPPTITPADRSPSASSS